jgi:site-specific DNA-methyltransferase (adenine-specific)
MNAVGDVDHIFSDPPYEAYMHEAKLCHRKHLRKDGGADFKELDFASIDEIRIPFVQVSEQYCKGWFLVFCTPEGVGRWADAINDSTIKYKRACTWIKPDSTPQLNGQGPAMGAENFVVAWAGSGFAKWNAGGKRGVYRHTVNPPDRHGTHPTEKPWRLFYELLIDFTNEGQTILDPFAGSGTTGVACIKSGRKFIGIEKDPKYFDVMCERIQKAVDQPDLFISKPSPEVQEAMEI